MCVFWVWFRMGWFGVVWFADVALRVLLVGDDGWFGFVISLRVLSICGFWVLAWLCL